MNQLVVTRVLCRIHKAFDRSFVKSVWFFGSNLWPFASTKDGEALRNREGNFQHAFRSAKDGWQRPRHLWKVWTLDLFGPTQFAHQQIQNIYLLYLFHFIFFLNVFWCSSFVVAFKLFKLFDLKSFLTIRLLAYVIFQIDANCLLIECQIIFNISTYELLPTMPSRSYLHTWQE